MATVTVTDDDFDGIVLGSDKPVLVDFWAAWCAPCRMVEPVLEELSEEYADTVTVAKLDVDQSPLVAQRYQVRSIPTLILFEDGEAKQAVQGALPKASIVDLLERSVSTLAPPRIDVATLARRLDAGESFSIVDLRAEADFDRAHLPGAIRREPDQVASMLADDDTAPIVLVCRVGRESEALAKRLAGHGREVVALEGGLLEWQGAGHDTFSTDEEKARGRS